MRFYAYSDSTKRGVCDKKIELGKQLGLEIRVEKGHQFYWYSYAVQKKGNIYYVYESEIAEENMAAEVFDYEDVFRYASLEDVKRHFPCKYGTCFKDIHVLKGERIFNVDFYDVLYT